MSERFMKYQTQSGVVLALREPDVAAITLAGISIYGLDRVLEKSDITRQKPADMPDSIWEHMKKAGMVKEDDPGRAAEQMRDILVNMRRLVVWMVAGIYDSDGNFHPGRATLNPKSSYDLDARTLGEEDLKHIWNLALSAGQKEVGNVEALQDFLAFVRKIGAFFADHGIATDGGGDYGDYEPVPGVGA